MRGAHETADDLTVPPNIPEVLEPHPEGLAGERHADELAVDALGCDPSKRFLADELRRARDDFDAVDLAQRRQVDAFGRAAKANDAGSGQSISPVPTEGPFVL